MQNLLLNSKPRPDDAFWLSPGFTFLNGKIAESSSFGFSKLSIVKIQEIMHMSNAILETAQKPQRVTFNSTSPSLMETISRKGFYTWPSYGSEAGGDLVLIQTSLLLLCK